MCNWTFVQHMLCNSSTFCRGQMYCACPDDFHKAFSVLLCKHSACTLIYVYKISGHLTAATLADLEWGETVIYCEEISQVHITVYWKLSEKKQLPACCFTTSVPALRSVCNNKGSIHLVSLDFFSPGKLPACCRCPLPLNRESVLVSGHNSFGSKRNWSNISTIFNLG